jgi:opacity protein-like surface antigen
MESRARHRCRIRGVWGGRKSADRPSHAGDHLNEGPPLWGFSRPHGYALDRLLLLDNVLVYLALGGAFGSFTDHMAVQVGPSFISYDQTTTRIRVSKAVGSLGIGAAHPITPNISVFVDYRYTALGPQWAHGRQINVQLPDGVTEASFGTEPCIIWYASARTGSSISAYDVSKG